MAQTNHSRPRTRSDFDIAIICALTIESNAVEASFDEFWEDGKYYTKAQGDPNAYTLGRIGEHNVVLAHMAGMGKVEAAGVARSITSSFPNVKLGLVIGVCGAAPIDQSDDEREILLGDIIISTGVIQYDLGRRLPTNIVRKDGLDASLGRPSLEIRNFIAKLKGYRGKDIFRSDLAKHLRDILLKDDFEESHHPGITQDKLYQPSYRHKHQSPNGNCDICAKGEDDICEGALAASCVSLGCNDDKVVSRKRIMKAFGVKNTGNLEKLESLLRPELHFGNIASGDLVMKSGLHRNKVAAQEKVIAFEMEGAGTWDNIPTVLIKSVCDYADSHKNKSWQRYAAVCAAAAAKAFLTQWRRHDPTNSANTSFESRVDQPCTDKSDVQEIAAELRSQALRAEDGARDEKAESKRAEILDWIPSVGFNDEHTRRCSIPATDCGLWLWEREAFQKWKEGQKSFLLCTGKPGSGKSVLAALTWDHINKERITNTAYSRFYCDSTDPKKTDAATMLTSIFKEICAATTELNNDLERLFAEKGRIERGGPSLGDVTQLFPSVIKQLSGAVILIDALDECSNPEFLLRSLLSLTTNTKMNVKVMIFSRNDHMAIDPLLKDSLWIRIDDGANHQDIQAYIDAKLNEADFSFRNERAIVRLVRRVMLKKAQGSFLWVNLQVQLLKGPLTLTQVKDRLAKLPKGIEKTYEQLLQRVLINSDDEVKELAVSVLVWVTNSTRPLSRNELLEALAVTSNLSSHDQMQRLTTDQQFTSLCGHLVYVDKKGYYHPAHLSIKEYLQQLGQDCPPQLRLYGEKQFQAHAVLASACLTYLSFQEFSMGPQVSVESLNTVLEQYSFLRYAAKNWHVHLRHASAPSVVALACKFLRQSACRDLSFQIVLISDANNLQNWYDIVAWSSSLYIIAYFGLRETEPEHSSVWGEIFEKDGLGLTPFDYALQNKRDEQTCLWLLRGQERRLVAPRLGAFQPLKVSCESGWLTLTERLLYIGFNPNLEDDEPSERLWHEVPLLLAALHGYPLIVETLLRHNADIRRTDKHGRNALHLASMKDQYDVVDVLLRKGMDVESMDNYGYSAMVFAARANSSRIIRLLHSAGAKLNCVGGITQPMHVAVYYNSSSAVSCLLGLGLKIDDDIIAAEYKESNVIAIFATPNDPDTFRHTFSLHETVGATCLHIAAGNGSASLTELLLDKGARSEPTRAGALPLHKAALSGSSETVRLLLTRENRDAQTDKGSTPLHLAIDSESKEMVEDLLSYGADLYLPDADGLTPVSWAVLRATPGQTSEVIMDCILNHLERQGQIVCKTHEAPCFTSPIHAAAAYGTTELMTRLLEAGMDPNLQLTHSKQTPLISAAIYANISQLKHLVANNANVSHRDAFGKNAADYLLMRRIDIGCLRQVPDDSVALSSEQRATMLAGTVQRCIDSLTTDSSLTSQGVAYTRRPYLEVLGKAIASFEHNSSSSKKADPPPNSDNDTESGEDPDLSKLFRTESCSEAAHAVFSELYFSEPINAWVCFMCGKPVGDTVFVCPACPRAVFCESCRLVRLHRDVNIAVIDFSPEIVEDGDVDPLRIEMKVIFDSNSRMITAPLPGFERYLHTWPPKVNVEDLHESALAIFARIILYGLFPEGFEVQCIRCTGHGHFRCAKAESPKESTNVLRFGKDGRLTDDWLLSIRAKYDIDKIS